MNICWHDICGTEGCGHERQMHVLVPGQEDRECAEGACAADVQGPPGDCECRAFEEVGGALSEVVSFVTVVPDRL